MTPQLQPAPGDVLCTRGTGWESALIRFGAALTGAPNLVNHVAVVSHRDAAGTLWVIEGRPGGVGYADARQYLASPWTLSNQGQPKTDAQRVAVVAVVTGMLGTPYDWSAIIADAMHAAWVDTLWTQDWHGQGPPGHVVCSALAAYAYGSVKLPCPRLTSSTLAAATYKQTGLPSPVGGRFVTPAEWAQFILTRRFD